MRKISQTEDEVVHRRYCTDKRPSASESCNTDVCPPQWDAGQWSSVSDLNSGITGRRNSYNLRRRDYETIGDGNDKISRFFNWKRFKVKNDLEVIRFFFTIQCKPRCGPGHKTRDVTCMSSDRRINYDDDVCDALQRPSTRMRCNNGPCPTARWMVSQWSQVGWIVVT